MLNATNIINDLKSEEMILGLPKKMELSVFFENNKNNYIENIEILFEKICTSLYNLIEKVWNEKERDNLRHNTLIKIEEKKKISLAINKKKTLII